ncbi:MAG: caspase family protein [Syntrophales bacterium]|nr:caspase family protein [Syntrophales bacterium]
MLLTNDEATVIKISRFITNNAMKLLDKDDTFILYFGGHGAPDVDSASNDNDGLKKYLLLHDSDLNSLPMTALSLNNLALLLEKLPCKRIVILLDSCFAGTAGMQTLSKLKGIRISEKSYKNITELSGEGRVILAASNENQVSHEEDSLQAGVFTHYLLEGLNGKADLKGDGKINILGLYEYVSKEVSRQTQNKQSPVFRGTLDANIIF